MLPVQRHLHSTAATPADEGAAKAKDWELLEAFLCMTNLPTGVMSYEGVPLWLVADSWCADTCR
jgi:hypothetical protein